MQRFQFQGNWHFSLELPAFKGFQSKEGQPDGVLKIEIMEHLNTDADPTPQQIAAIHYLLAHQKKIHDAIVQHIRADYSNLVACYGVEDEYIPAAAFRRKQGVKRLIRFSTIIVQLAHKDGMSYLGFLGWCDWDPEHGLGLTLLQNKIIDYSDQTAAYSHIAKDNSDLPQYTEYYADNDAENLQLPTVHPKYGTLKPSQTEQLNAYLYHLVETGQFEKCRDTLQYAEQYAHQPLPYDLIKMAYIHFNAPLLDLFLSKGWAVLEWGIRWASIPAHFDYLISKGIDLHQPHPNVGGHVILEAALRHTLYHLQFSMRQPSYYAADFWDNSLLFIEYLLKKGVNRADVQYGLDYWHQLTDTNEVIKQRTLQILKKVLADSEK
jgi:hypothetical protein